jgi:hypothetical protein
MLGKDHLMAKLIPGSDLNLKDQKYNSPPLGWAIHGWSNSPAGDHGREREVVARLLAAGAKIEPEWVNSEKVQADAEIFEALKGPFTTCEGAAGRPVSAHSRIRQ